MAIDPTVLTVLDLLGIFVFAVSGALVAVRKGYDIVGVLMLAGATGLGGGFARDALIGATPAASLVDWWYLVVPLVAGAFTFVCHPTVGRLEHLVNVFDALGLAFFVVAGAAKAMDYGLGPVSATLLGLISGAGGGILRDVLAGRVPVIFQPSTLYAIPGVAGAAVAAFGIEAGLPGVVVTSAGAAVCAVWRLLAMWKQWQAPLPRGSASV